MKLPSLLIVHGGIIKQYDPINRYNSSQIGRSDFPK
jgi:hypothetical protein